MKRYLATLIKVFGGNKRVIDYHCVSAKNANSARNKVDKYIRQTLMPGRYSLVSVTVSNITLVEDNAAQEIKRQIAQVSREIKSAEYFLAHMRKTRHELTNQLWSLER